MKLGGAQRHLGDTSVVLTTQFSPSFLIYKNCHLLHALIISLNVFGISEASCTSVRQRMAVTEFFTQDLIMAVVIITSTVQCQQHMHWKSLVTVNLRAHAVRASLKLTRYPRMTSESQSSFLHLPECGGHRCVPPTTYVVLMLESRTSCTLGAHSVS